MYSQEDRPLRIDTPLGEDALLLFRLDGHEEISDPFLFRANVYAENPNLEVERLLRSPALVSTWAGGEAVRYIHGHISRVQQGRRTQYLTNYQLEIRPWLWFLSLNQDCRIFQHLSVPDIVQEIFAKYPGVLFEFRLHAIYPRREYCVQYCESDLSFVSRLLEEEGIFYYFEHTAENHKLILSDTSGIALPVPHQSEVKFRPMEPGVIEDIIGAFDLRHEVFTAQYSLTDYDFEKPHVSLAATIRVDGTGEKFAYPGRYTSKDEGQRYAKLRLEEAECRSVVAEGEGSCRAFLPGFRFHLEGHYREELDDDYLITRVEHEAFDNSYTTAQQSAAPYGYSNRFVVVPASARYRPLRRTPKPEIRGSQTAVVTGKPGTEVWDDHHGRIKVHFHWDRHNRRDDSSSCWIRVSQYWAGKDWGSLSIPRVGQEVIVDFLEGDPDRPIIAGRVYNADQTPPYPLPGGDANMGFKSKTLYGNGYNEITINDTAGREMITIHSQYDMQTRVENNETISIGNSRAEQVAVDESIFIGNNRVEQVGVDEQVQIGNNRLEIVGNSKDTQVANAYTIECDTLKVQAKTSIDFICGAASIHMNQAGVITIKGTLVSVIAVAIANLTAPITNIVGAVALTMNAGIAWMFGGVVHIVSAGVARLKGSQVKINC